ncbi:histidine phosphatase family protein [Candidatus Gracilibacteria bacterium]|nr:histidine phosphatase family protein [Candidatus Gracilibacteria bacterium]NJM87610.1 histidine phosphatase family protein [Hydrococcus sp. RU_2_2]NJP18283.1 histidine phosphatase family protein [Hydrococcus sp. CRU_1_1]
MLSTNTRVILLRHGQSTYNVLGLYQGSSDRSNLTELGRQQAILTGTFLKNIKFDAIYSSPLKRAQETAIEVLKKIDPTVVPQTVDTVPQLKETDLPAWQGFPFQFIREQFPEDYSCWKQRPHEFRMEIPLFSDQLPVTSDKSEVRQSRQSPIQNPHYCFPALDLYDRVQQFWQEILPRHIGQTLLIISHGGTNRALISTALGISPAHYHQFEQSNCALSILNFPNGCLESGTLEMMNCTTHLDDNLPKCQENGLQLLLIPAHSTNYEQIQALAKLLKDKTIDLSISGDIENSHAIAKQILQHHPTALQLQVIREDFPQIWQQAIKTRKLADCDRLLTGLIIASDRTIQQFLTQTLNINDDQWRLQIHPGSISIVHYPNSEHPPILQAINLGNWDIGDWDIGK